MEYQKIKSVAKQVTAKGPALSDKILTTLKTISDIVGATLGPGGSQVLIERFEHGIPPSITKDGVTVFRALGFTDAARHCIMEAARDAAVRTASEAGDGTTTATILAEAIVRLLNAYCTANPTYSPQKIVRRMEEVFRLEIEPLIQSLSTRVDFATPEGRALLQHVAKVSANGDGALGEAVLECFDLVGDEGNVTIVESQGPSNYQVEKIEGYPVPIGYEDSCGGFYPKFLNDPGRQMCVLEDPVFVLYHGILNDVMVAYSLLEKVGAEFEARIKGQQSDYRHHCVVFVAAGFSEQVVGTFAAGMQAANALRIFPLVIPKNPLQNYGAQFLEDLAAITGATVFDPINRPLDSGTLEDLGPGVVSFEASRFRSTVIGRADRLGEPWETKMLDQVDVVAEQLKRPESELDKILLQERYGKLTGGIAKLRVIGSSNGELKEKRDRADDAVCAVRGAIKSGCLPGGGWTLMRVAYELRDRVDDPAVSEVLVPALLEPLRRLHRNCGMTEDEVEDVMDAMRRSLTAGEVRVYDAQEHTYGDPMELGIYDSTPAVLEAVRSSISIASLLGTLGGTVVFARDEELERTEARDVQEWKRNAETNPADERA